MPIFSDHRARQQRRDIEADYAAWVAPVENHMSLEEYGAAAREVSNGMGPLGGALDATLTVSRRERKAAEEHVGRSGVAQGVDDRRRAPLTVSYEEWAADPARRDFPGIDTPPDADLLPELGGRPGYLDLDRL